MRRHLSPGLRSSRHAVALGWLIAALLLGQWLGSLHRIVHATSGAAAFSNAAPAAARDAASGDDRSPEEVRSLLERLFASHGKADCVLFDQALQPSPAAAPVLLPPAPCAIALPVPTSRGIVHSGGASSFEARAPPSLNRRLFF